MHILILINDESTILNFRMELVERLISKGYYVSISSPNGARLDLLKEMGCRIVPTQFNRRGTSPVDDIRLLFSYISLLRDQKPSVVLTYTVKPNIYGGLASRITRIPQIATITGLGDSVSNAGLLQRVVLGLSRLSFKKTKVVFFQNSSNLNFYIDEKIVNKSQSKLISGSGVNLEKYSYTLYPTINNNTIRLVFIGRILKDKGIGELLEAVTSIHQEKSSIICDLVGFYEDDTFKQAITDYEHLGAGTFLGVSKDISSLLKEYHAVILPSYHEGMANVLLEAAASGRPVLASKVPGCQETFDEGISGIGFEAKSVDSLYNAIKKFLSLTPEQREAMGRAGRAKMEREFDRQLVVDAYMEQIEKYCSAT